MLLLGIGSMFIPSWEGAVVGPYIFAALYNYFHTR